MEKVVITPRLKLILLEKAERGSQEFEWLHKLRTNEQSTFWSLLRTSKTPEDTERAISKYMPLPADSPKKAWRIVYAVHEILPSPPSTTETTATNPSSDPTNTEFIGLVNVNSVEENGITLPVHLTIPAAEKSTTLSAEVAYMFLPTAWNRGYATEAVSAVLAACGRAPPEFWHPYARVLCRAIVNSRNKASQRVVEKVGMPLWGVYSWKGEEPLFIGGEWKDHDELPVYALCVFGGEEGSK